MWKGRHHLFDMTLMKHEDEWAIRLQKAIDHFEGSKELGLSREFMVSELQRLGDDDDLIDRLHNADMKEIRSG